MKYYAKQWFTLVEIMIVLVIITFMMLLVSAPYGYFQQKAKVKVAGREIAQAIYEAKNLAISGKSFKKTDSSGNEIDTNKSIWLVFEKNADVIKYYEFDGQKVVTTIDPNSDTTQITSSQIVFPAVSEEPFKQKQLQKWVIFWTIWWEEKVLFFFEAITGKLYVEGIPSVGNNITISYGIKWVTDSSSGLKKDITYFPETNTTFYK